VSVSHEHGQLVIWIQRGNDRTTPMFGRIFTLFLSAFVGWMFVPACFRVRSFTEFLYGLPLSGLFVADETLVWTRQALCLTRKIAPYKDITAITAKTFPAGWVVYRSALESEHIPSETRFSARKRRRSRKSCAMVG
jgi:hypothetical protein